MEQSNNLIDIEAIIQNKNPKLYKKLPGFVINWLKKIICQDKINRLLTLYGHLQGVEFIDAVFADFNVDINCYGLENLKEWLSRRRKAFEPAARNYGLEEPRGIMLLGLPGTGKSLAAKAVANAWQLPLLRLDMGRIFGGIVGQSEENMRTSLNLAETLSPCILWIDEIEKGMAGIQSSGSTDGGVTARVLGTFLTWMQEKNKPVFVVATANNIAQLPPELLRKGRVDEIFFVDLPTKRERIDILTIHINKKAKTVFLQSELEELAESSKGFTGAELEEAVKDAMYRAFEDNERAVTANDVLISINATTPLSQTMRNVINDTRLWAKGRAVMASRDEPEDLDEPDIDVVYLPQETQNPFLKGYM